MEDELVAIGHELYAVEAVLAQQGEDSDALALVRRVLAEQYERDEDGELTLRPPGDVGAGSLQSPHDPEATYRFKGGERYRGYVANVSETAHPENELQLITDVQVEPNRADDTDLMRQSLDGQRARGIEVKRVTTDGGYTGPRGEAICKQREVELRATRMRGRASAGDGWGWEDWHWELGEEGRPLAVTCPCGSRAEVLAGRAPGRFIARFGAQRCRRCPFFGNRCPVQNRSRVGPTLYLTRRTVDVAQQRRRLHPEDAPLRAVVESTVRSLKRGFPANKLPVRGLIRSRMAIYPAAMMVNLRRLHRHLTTAGTPALQEAVSSLSSIGNALAGHLERILSAFSEVHHARLSISC
jgi:hypothetical protein